MYQLINEDRAKWRLSILCLWSNTSSSATVMVTAPTLWWSLPLEEWNKPHPAQHPKGKEISLPSIAAGKLMCWGLLECLMVEPHYTFFWGGGIIQKWGMFALDDFAPIWSAAGQGHAQNLLEIPNGQGIPKVISPHGNQFGWISSRHRWEFPVSCYSLRTFEHHGSCSQKVTIRLVARICAVSTLMSLAIGLW